MPASPERTYNLLTGYRFARRYVEGRSVADLGWTGVGYGTCLLAETAESVTGISDSREAVESASEVYAVPNVEYRKTSLPDLPFPADSFDVVVALGVIEKLEHQESLLASIKHVLKPGGTLVLSTPDKQAHSNERNQRDSDRVGEMYVPELREMLLRHFGGVSVYRQGAVSGGVIFSESGGGAVPSMESAGFTFANPSFDAEPPATDHVIAVCTDYEAAGGEAEPPYLLLDRDRRVFEECDDRTEDTRLLQEEIRQMQETEVQAFQNALKVRDSEIADLKAHLQGSDTQLRSSEARAQRLAGRVQAIENSRTWRTLGVYRRLRAGLGTLRKR